MSRRKPSQHPPRPHRSKQPDQTGQQTSWKRTLLTAALAIIVSVAVIAQLSSPTSMLGAIRRVEYLSFAQDDEGSARPGEARTPTWDQIAAQRDAALRSHPDTGPHFAVARLLRLLSDVQHKRQPAAEAVAAAGPQAAADPRNLIARLAHAALVDLQASADLAGGSSPDRRFEAMRAIVQAEPAADRATLYNAEFTEVWHRVLAQHIERPDVAVSLAVATYHWRTTDHYAALPVIGRRIGDLARALQAEGRQDDADTCRRWIAEAALGLIDADPDAATRLLCVQLLAETLEQGPSAATADASAAAKMLRQLRTDYHAAAERAPIDMCDQAFTSRPSVSPEEYNAAFRWLVITCVPALVAAAAAGLFLIAGPVALIKSAFSGKQQEPATEKPCPGYTKFSVALFPTFATASLIVAAISGHGIHSAGWGMAMAAVVFAAGGLVAIALAGVVTKVQSSTGRCRLAASSALALAVILIAVLPPPTVTRCQRWLVLAGGGQWILMVIPVVLIFATAWLSPARLRTIAAAAALTWALNSTAALVAFQVHRSLDKAYQQAVVAVRLDEFSARLGPDWQGEYLERARREVMSRASTR